MDPAHLWSLGEYELVQPRLEPAAEALVEATGVAAGTRLLDVAAGTGNVTVAAARRGARVTASDIAPAMIEKGQARTRAEGFDVEWHEADAQALPFEDGAFDVVLSAFGAMFAPDPALTARELLRVAAPGGVVAITTWVHGGLNGVASDHVTSFMPSGATTPAARGQWGTEESARSFFERCGADVTVQRRTLSWSFDSPEASVEYMERGAPPMVAARTALGESTWERVREGLIDIAREHGRTTDEGFVVEPPYLLIVAR